MLVAFTFKFYITIALSHTLIVQGPKVLYLKLIQGLVLFKKTFWSN